MIYLGFILASALVYAAFAISAVALNHKRLVNWLFAIFQIEGAIWAFSYFMMYLIDDLETAIFWFRMSSIGWLFIPTVYLHFSAELTGKPTGAVKRWVLLAGYMTAMILFARGQYVPLVTTEFVRHNYYWSEVVGAIDQWGLLLIINSAWPLMLGAWLQFQRARTAKTRIDRKQSWVILVTVLLALVMNYVIDIIIPMTAIEPVPAIGVAMNIIPNAVIYWAFWYYENSQLTPVLASDRILDRISDGIIIVDEEGIVLSLNESAGRLFGRSLRKGKPVRSLFINPPDQLNRPMLPDSRFRFESTLNLAMPVSVQVDVAAFHNREGDYIGSSIVVRDIRPIEQLRDEIRERKVTQSKLERTLVDLNRANQVRTDFLTRVSHEIRTPMNAILGASDLLAETNLTESQKEYVSFARRSGETLLGLIDNLLDLARMDSGRFQITITAFAPTALAEDVYAILWARAEAKNIDLRFDIEPMPKVIETDEKALRQILLNLGDNAIKFTDQGVITITLAVIQRGGRTLLAIGVEDTGIGIDPEKINEIFLPFMQQDSSITRRYGGTGLGLAIVHELIEQLHGKITVVSEPGLFTRFDVEVPVVIVDVPVEESERSAEVVLPEAKIMIAEDSVENRQLLQALFRKQPVEITFAEDGAQAIQLFKARSFDLILMDLQMPVVDGYTATSEIREYEKNNHLSRTIILAFTAHAMADASDQAKAAGCDGVIVKPVRKQDLFESIAYYLMSKD